MTTWIQPLSIASAAISGMLSGLSFDISLVTMPAIRVAPTPDIQVRQWRAVYNMGSQIGPRTAVLSLGLCFTNSYLAYSSDDRPFFQNPRALYYLGAGLLQVGIVPFTLAFIAPTNNALFKMDDGFRAGKIGVEAASKVTGLLSKWTALNSVRGVFSLSATVLTMYAMCQ